MGAWRSSAMDWEDRLDEWELQLELTAQLEGSDWVTLERAAAETGVSRAALRNWYRTDQIPSRLVDGPHGPRRRLGYGAPPSGGWPTRRSLRSCGTGLTSLSFGWRCLSASLAWAS